jgi:hypothetical protein
MVAPSYRDAKSIIGYGSSTKYISRGAVSLALADSDYGSAFEIPRRLAVSPYRRFAVSSPTTQHTHAPDSTSPEAIDLLPEREAHSLLFASGLWLQYY